MSRYVTRGWYQISSLLCRRYRLIALGHRLDGKTYVQHGRGKVFGTRASSSLKKKSTEAEAKRQGCGVVQRVDPMWGTWLRLPGDSAGQPCRFRAEQQLDSFLPSALIPTIFSRNRPHAQLLRWFCAVIHRFARASILLSLSFFEARTHLVIHPSPEPP